LVQRFESVGEAGSKGRPFEPAFDFLAQPLASIPGDDGRAHQRPVAGVPAHADVVSQKANPLGHRGDERLRLRERQAHLFLQELGQIFLLSQCELPGPFLLLRSRTHAHENQEVIRVSDGHAEVASEPPIVETSAVGAFLDGCRICEQRGPTARPHDTLIPLVNDAECDVGE
jgi:hypothetical protein